MKQQNMPLSIGHYLNNMAKLTNQWNNDNFRETDRQRIYLKDIDCPQVWHEKLKEQIPAAVFYLNESTGELGGPGSVDEPNAAGPGTRKGRGVARAGDLMSVLPPAMRADNMMCYIGHEGTYTPAHREMCASLGHNVMVETSSTFDENGKPAKPGSSIWFMTETKDRHLVSEYWLSVLGHNIEIEAHFAQINAWKAAPFTTYILEQKAGDFVLIPPLAPHQVWNRGTRTMKVAWNRTTVETLEMALVEAIPRARMVCRDEQYKNKAIVYFALDKYSGLLKQVDLQKQNAVNAQARLDLDYSPKIRQLQKDFKRLFALYTRIMLSEMFSPNAPTEKRIQYLPFDSFVTCSYCRCNIFNRFLTCTSCVVPLENGEEDTYDICMECYTMGRSCHCVSKYKWVEQFKWQDLVEKHDLWRHQIIGFEGGLNDKSPQPLHVERKQLDKKTLAQVCQEQMEIRPSSDSQKKPTPEPEEEGEEDDIVKADGTVKKRRKKRHSEKWLKEHISCHVCKDRHPSWKVIVCGCGLAFCYGTLWRAHDIMPLSIMENLQWKCPHCLKMCSAGGCRKDPEMNPPEPTSTLLGYDTKKVADQRSVEVLVNFSHSNLAWVKKAGDDHPHETRRLQRRKSEACAAKSKDPALDENYVEDEGFSALDDRYANAGIKYVQDGEIPIDPLLSLDPQLSTGGVSITSLANSSCQQAESDPTESPSDGHGQPASESLRELPSVTAMLDTSAQHERRSVKTSAVSINGNVRSKKANKHANGLNHPAQRQAPEAKMVSQGDRNGSAYQYPEPPQMQAVTSPLVSRFNGVPQNGVQISRSTRKRKRSGIDTILKSDILSTSKNKANDQYQEAQIQKTLADAKRNGRLISAEAAISGKQLKVRIPVTPDMLATLDAKQQHTRSVSSPLVLEKTTVTGEETILVQSDLPPTFNPVNSAFNGIHTTVNPRKRKVRAESDEDFSTRKTRDRRTSGARTSLAEGPHKPVYNDISSGVQSESDGGVKVPSLKTKDTGTPRKRQKPAYLAQRSEVDEHDLPKELNSEARKRKSQPKPAAQPAVTANLVCNNRSQRPSLSSSTVPKHKPRRSSTLRRTGPANDVDDVMMSDLPHDEFAVEPVPQLDPDEDLSMLGPGGISVAKDSFKTLGAEHQAKEDSMPSEDEEDDVYELSESVSSSARYITKLVHTASATSAKARYTQPPKEQLYESPAKPRGSMFSRPGMQGKKIKIVSAKKLV